MRTHLSLHPPAEHPVETTPYVPAGTQHRLMEGNREEIDALLRGRRLLTDGGREVSMLHPYGRGGFGDVWIATAGNHPSTVIVKFAREFRTDPERSSLSARRLMAEARMLGSLSHEGIPKLLGQGSANGLPFLLIDHVHGKTWREILDRIEPTKAPSEFLRRAAELAILLSHLHGKGIVHGDVKPENILSGFTTDPGQRSRTWLIDFGLAFRHRRHDELLCGGLTVGTRGYLDPCVIGRAHERSFATDIYALGAMIFEGYARMPLFSKTEWNEAMLLRNDVEYGRLSEREFGQWYQHLLAEKTECFAFAPERSRDVEDLIGEIIRAENIMSKRPTASDVADRLISIAQNLS